MRTVISVIAIVLQCSAIVLAQSHAPLRVAVSKGSGTIVANYIKWLKAARADVEIVELAGLSAEESAIALNNIDGLVLSGGADVDPQRYDRSDLRSICETDTERDRMEFALIEQAQKLKLPVLGICRGLQILNVAYGGSLIADIPTQYQTTIEHRSDRERKIDAKHGVQLVPGGLLHQESRVTQGDVNSAHHQCINKLALPFKVSGYSSDGIVEAIEWTDEQKRQRPFLFAVQWHPERLAYDNPLSLTIAKRFLAEVEKNRVATSGK